MVLRLLLLLCLALSGCGTRVDAPGAGPGSPPAGAGPAPSGVPWTQDGVLHVAGQEVEVPPESVVLHRGGTTLVGERTTGLSRWWLLSAGRLVPVIDRPEVIVPVVSADGRTLVWADPVAEDVRRLVAYDVAQGREVGTLDVPVRVECCDQVGELALRGADATGRVYFSTYHLRDREMTTHAWTPGESRAVEVLGADTSFGVWPGGGVMVYVEPTGGPKGWATEYGAVDASGAYQRLGGLHGSPEWNPDGTAYAHGGDEAGESHKTGMDDLWVEHVDTGRRVRMALPEEFTHELVAWESGDSVVVQQREPFVEGAAAPGLVALLRCDAASGACERTGDDPGPHAVPASLR